MSTDADGTVIATTDDLVSKHVKAPHAVGVTFQSSQKGLDLKVLPTCCWERTEMRLLPLSGYPTRATCGHVHQRQLPGAHGTS
jgi:hypothetical protein